MARGGKRENAGRKPGAITKRTREIAEAASAGGITPLEYMLSQLRDVTLDREVRMDAAKAAAPFVHARLAAVEHSGDMTLRHEDALDELDEPGKEDPAPTAG